MGGVLLAGNTVQYPAAEAMVVTFSTAADAPLASGTRTSVVEVGVEQQEVARVEDAVAGWRAARTGRPTSAPLS